MYPEHKEQDKSTKEDNGFMLSLQCPSCDWIWSKTFSCSVESATPRCNKCSHEPVLVLKIYAV